MRLDRIIFKDFLTYKDFDYTFENRPLSVQGLNLTDDNQTTNGSGKSGIQTGIEFCITASNSRGVRDSELITFGKSESVVELFASCDVREETIHIKWTIKAKGSNRLELGVKKHNSENWDDISFSTVNDGKKFILSWFAISKDDLFNYFIINKSRFKSFFNSSNKEKVDLINRFSDASIVDGVEKIDVSKEQGKISELQSNVDSVLGKIELTKEQIEEENNRDFESELKEKKEELNLDIEDILSDIEDLDGEIDQKEEDISDIESKIVETKESLPKIRAEIKRLKEAVKKETNSTGDIRKLIDEAKNSLFEFINKQTDWEEKREMLEVKVEETEKKISDENKRKEEFEKKYQLIKKKLNSIDIKLSGEIVCPNCSHHFLLDDDIEKLKEKRVLAEDLAKNVKKIISKIDLTVGELKPVYSNIRKDISKINKKEQSDNDKKNELKDTLRSVEDKLSDKESEILKLKKDILKKESEASGIDSKVDSLKLKQKAIENSIGRLKEYKIGYKKDIKKIRTEISELKIDDNKDRIEELNKKIKDFEKTHKKLNKSIGEINDKIYEKNQWASRLKKFRMFLANQSLEAIQYHCNRYLKDMGSDMLVRLDGFKELADGSIKDEITAKIIRDKERTFSSFSGGEQGRLLFAAILANRYMINQTHPYGGLDFLSIDEIFEGVDSLGLKLIVNAAKDLSVPVMIITHVTDDEVSDDTLLIVKENGISYIKNK